MAVFTPSLAFLTLDSVQFQSLSFSRTSTTSSSTMPGSRSYRGAQASASSTRRFGSSGDSFVSSSSSQQFAQSHWARPEPLFGGDSDGDGSRDSLSSYQHGGGGGGRESLATLHLDSSLSSIPSMDDFPPGDGDEDDDGEQSFELQLLAYRLIYVLQGAFLGLLGPALQHFSQLARDGAGLDSPVSSFGPIFAAHGGAALLVSFVSELVLNVAIEMSVLKYLMLGLLLASGAWYACLPPVAAASGSLGVAVYFIAKGGWSALLNISCVPCPPATSAAYVAGRH